MKPSRYAIALLSISLLGCAHSRTRIQRDDSANFSSYRAIGVPSFTDPKGQGLVIAETINADLQKLMYDPVDQAALEKILTKYKPGKDSGYDLEALEIIRRKTSADAVVLGRMAPDWSMIFLTMFETQMGSPVLRAVIRPQGKKKVFASPAEISLATIRVITGEEK